MRPGSSDSVRRQRPRHAHRRHDVGRRLPATRPTAYQPGHGARRPVDRLSQHAQQLRHTRPATPPASSSCSRPTRRYGDPFTDGRPALSPAHHQQFVELSARRRTATATACARWWRRRALPGSWSSPLPATTDPPVPASSIPSRFTTPSSAWARTTRPARSPASAAAAR